ncbi:bifunctional riboflavin kinase/FAD synthetase [Alteromonas oceanisediminis]|uniref:bifunctional riboflavin kinase/FAD synthetase n=1 Tax=Alteromonas oceanisediminis TaxID=2836180 RepID=UPI001BD96559|nr:bifunctional riboflavin kinase/FAD synthetase [Alteromonas oceanisediminis]MBT0585777.1 bifunctional riboflavin kinase/FAD synthetase [Alteromonas oceanisediminis]
MELVQGLHNLRDKHRGCVLTIGKFDGVHLGHQAVLSQLIVQARERNLPATVMVFEPQPEEVFFPNKAPARLSTLRDKYRALQALGIDRLVCVKFNAAFAEQSPQHFIDDLLVDRLGVEFLVVGDDFRFGKAREGDFAMLAKAGLRAGFTVVNTQSFRVEDCRISSTAIRQALQAGNFDYAEQMLGRPFSITGKVVHGEKRGRTIGFPTANVLLKRLHTPINGVFAVRVDVSGSQYAGVANIGHRPTVHGTRSQLEVHLFDFDARLYGQTIAVIPTAKIREEQKFESFDLLKAQIVNDAQQAKVLLQSAT